MSMTKILTAAVLATLAAGGLTPPLSPATAATFVVNDCTCASDSNNLAWRERTKRLADGTATEILSHECGCGGSYELRKSATKESRFRCDPGTAMYPSVSKAKMVTCTVSFPTSGYLSKSCTNWNAFKRNTVDYTYSCQTETRE